MPIQAAIPKSSKSVEFAATHFLCRLEAAFADVLRDEPSISLEDYEALIAIGQRWVERNTGLRDPKAGAAFAATVGRCA